MDGSHGRNRLNLAGQRFGKLVAIAPSDNIGRRITWLCRCDCVSEMIAKTVHLRAGKVKSCGCLCNDPRPVPINDGKPVPGKGRSVADIQRD